MIETIVSLLFFAATFAVAFVLSWIFGTTGGRVWAFHGLGCGLALVYLAVIYFGSPTDGPPNGCSDCGEYWGRWWEPWPVGYVLGLALLAWAGGVVAGSEGRRLAKGS